MVYYFILEPLSKCLEANPHLRMNFQTPSASSIKLGTFFIKFGTSTSNATRTLILSPMVHYFILEPLRKCLEAYPYIGMHFGSLCTPFTKFGTFFTKFNTSFIKFGTLFIKFGTSNPISIGAPV